MDRNHPDDTLSLQIVYEGAVLTEVVADGDRQDLAAIGERSTRHGFDAQLPGLDIADPFRVRFVVKGFDHELTLPDGWSPTIVQIDWVGANQIIGWAWDSFQPDRHVRLRFFHKDNELGFAIANVYRSDLVEAGIGAGDHGFDFPLLQPLAIAREELRIDIVRDTSKLLLSPDEAPLDGEHNKTQLYSNLNDLNSREDVASDEQPGYLQLMEWSEVAREYFDPVWYSEQIHKPDLSPDLLFADWWSQGRKRGMSPHPLFDTDFYRNGLRASGMRNEDLFLEFLRHGGDQDVDPHPCFSMKWYKARYQNFDFEHPWRDYVTYGALKQREPNWGARHVLVLLSPEFRSAKCVPACATRHDARHAESKRNKRRRGISVVLGGLSV
jgi:hypothetical protein